MNSQNYENAIRTSLKKRYAKETRLKFYGIISISFALSFLAIFLYTIFINGYTALQQTQTLVSIQIPSDKIMNCLLYTSPSPRDPWKSRMPSSA